jgi:hypothetical protein
MPQAHLKGQNSARFYQNSGSQGDIDVVNLLGSHEILFFIIP